MGSHWTDKDENKLHPATKFILLCKLYIHTFKCFWLYATEINTYIRNATYAGKDKTWHGSLANTNFLYPLPGGHMCFFLHCFIFTSHPMIISLYYPHYEQYILISLMQCNKLSIWLSDKSAVKPNLLQGTQLKDQYTCNCSITEISIYLNTTAQYKELICAMKCVLSNILYHK
jgi:hypothetical protein